VPHQWFGLKLTLLLDTSRYRSDGAMSQGLHNLCLDQPDSTGMAVEEPNRGEASESHLYACFNSLYEGTDGGHLYRVANSPVTEMWRRCWKSSIRVDCLIAK
jgi:hypothetical protein